MRDVSTTPLGWCALGDNEGLMTLLLRARADPEIRNLRGKRPVDICQSEKMRAILGNPQLQIYLLEKNSEMVSESF